MSVPCKFTIPVVKGEFSRIEGTVLFPEKNLQVNATINRINKDVNKSTGQRFDGHDLVHVFNSFEFYCGRGTYSAIGKLIADFIGFTNFDVPEYTTLYLFIVVIVNSQELVGVPVSKERIIEIIRNIAEFKPTIIVNDKTINACKPIAMQLVQLLPVANWSDIPDEVEQVPISNPCNPCKCGSTKTWKGAHVHDIVRLKELGCCGFCAAHLGEATFDSHFCNARKAQIAKNKAKAAKAAKVAKVAPQESAPPG